MREDSSHQFLVEEGESAFSRQQWDKALECFTRALEDDPDNLRAFERIKDIISLKGDLAELSGFFSRYARTLISMQKFPDAVKILERILKLQPADYLPRLMIAEIHKEQHEIEKSFELFVKWGRIFNKNKMPEEALLFLQNALELKPTDRAITEEMAALLTELNRPGEAARHYRLLAEECMKADQPREALSALKTAQGFEKTLFPNVLNTRYLLAASDDGSTSLTGCLKVDFNEIGLLSDAAARLKEGRKYNDMVAVYEEILALDPGHGPTHETLGSFFIHKQDYDRAIRHFLTAAETYLAIDEKERAVRLYEKILRTDASHESALLKLQEMKKIRG